MKKQVLILVVAVMALGSIPASAQASPFVGEVDLVAFNFAPVGYAMCNGQILPISQNTALFSLIGTFYGGDGKTTFALPDLRGRRVVGMGQGPGLSTYDLGQSGGEESVTLLVNQLPKHSHPVLANTAVGTSLSPTNNYWASQTSTNLYSNAPNPNLPTSGTTVAMSPAAVGLAGQTLPHENRSPYLALNYVIALQGIFPSRQ